MGYNRWQGGYSPTRSRGFGVRADIRARRRAVKAARRRNRPCK